MIEILEKVKQRVEKLIEIRDKKWNDIIIKFVEQIITAIEIDAYAWQNSNNKNTTIILSLQDSQNYEFSSNFKENFIEKLASKLEIPESSIQIDYFVSSVKITLTL